MVTELTVIFAFLCFYSLLAKRIILLNPLIRFSLPSFAPSFCNGCCFNLIGDIYVVCKQTHYGKINDGVKKFKDVHGNVHYKRIFEPHEQLMQHVERKVSNRYISIQIWIILLLKIQLQMTSNISVI